MGGALLLLRFIPHTAQAVHPEVTPHVALNRELAPTTFLRALEWTLTRVGIGVDAKGTRSTETLATVLALVPAREWDCLESCT